MSKAETNTWGGARPGAGRPATGRKRRSLYVTEDEYKKIKKYLEKLRLVKNIR